MFKYTAEVKGMMCGMCEAHMNSAVRNAFNVKKVTSSHKKNQTVIITEQEIDEALLEKTVTGLGYDIGKIQKEPYKKKFWF